LEGEERIKPPDTKSDFIMDNGGKENSVRHIWNAYLNNSALTSIGIQTLNFNVWKVTRI